MTKLFTPDDVVYISGPMTGVPELNFPKFFEMEELLITHYGCRVLNPARHPQGLSYEDYMRLAFADLDRATGMVMLEGWSESHGARRELEHFDHPENVFCERWVRLNVKHITGGD